MKMQMEVDVVEVGWNKKGSRVYCRLGWTKGFGACMYVCVYVCMYVCIEKITLPSGEQDMRVYQ